MQINYIDDNSSERLPEPESFDNIFANIGELRELQHIHTAAMMQLRLKFEILNSEFRVHHHRNPIHHIESRLKSTRSMYNKLVQRGFPTSIESAKKNLNDIAGVRVVCCYIDDVYDMEDMLLRQSDVRLIERTDYIKIPILTDIAVFILMLRSLCTCPQKLSMLVRKFSSELWQWIFGQALSTICVINQPRTFRKT